MYTKGEINIKVLQAFDNGSWLAECGAYVDLIAKYSRLENDFAIAGDMTGKTDANALSLSAETGYRFSFVEDHMFVEPQVELSYGHVAGDTFKAGLVGPAVDFKVRFLFSIATSNRH